MATPLSTCEQAIGPAIVIQVTGPDGVPTTHQLVSGDALVIGSNPACGVRLPSDEVAGMHCTFSFEDGALVVDDWDTGSGTYVNGTRVARQMTVDIGAEVRIGPYRLTTTLDETKESEAPASSIPAAVSSNLTESFVESVPTSVTESFEETALVERATSEADDVWDSPLDDFGATDQQAELVSSAYDHSSFDDDTEAHLQMEVGFLRTELAERDARIAELEEYAARPIDNVDDEMPSREEVDALATRLESLLAELDQSDERLKAMAELLRTSEEANLAAEEERTQMESWIGEVERRVRQWEEEWHAERDNLNKQIAELTAQRDAAESRGDNPAQGELIQSLREEAKALRTRLQQAQTEREDMQTRLENAEIQSIEERVAAAVEESLREERLQISQMKAEFARERARIAQEQEEMISRQGLLAEEPDVADIRIRAFREHLKEIRAAEPADRPAPTMSQRLGKLWRRIEGKPLDTD